MKKTGEGQEYTLEELTRLMERFKHMANDPELTKDALEWDGQAPVNPIERYLTPEARLSEAELDRMEQEEKEKAAREYLESHSDSPFGDDGGFSSSLKNARELADIRAAAVKDGSFLKAPNGKASKLTEEQWLFARTARFKEMYGDFERYAELSFTGEDADYAFIDEKMEGILGKPLRNDETGIVAYVNRRQKDKKSGTKAQKKSVANGFSTSNHNEVVSRIDKVFQYAIYIGEYENYKNTGAQKDPNILGIKRFVCPIKIKGKEAFCFITAKEIKMHGHRVYSLELDTIETLAANAKRLKKYERSSTASVTDDIVARMEDAVKTYFGLPEENMGENGEPRAEVVETAMKEAEEDFSAAMESAAQLEMARRVNEILLGRREEREARMVMESWDSWMKRFKVVMAAHDGKQGRLGRGMEALAKLVALLESTRNVLPQKYRIGWITMQLDWATWYAQMMESGEVGMTEKLADDARAAKWAERFRAELEKKKAVGVDEEGVKRWCSKGAVRRGIIFTKCR